MQHTLADWWHMVQENEPITNLAEALDHLRHVHVPVPVPPLPGSPIQRTDESLPEFLWALLALNHSGRVSVEDNGSRFHRFHQEAPQALAYLQTHLDN